VASSSELGIGVRGPEALDLLDPLTAARHDLDRYRPGRRAHLSNEPGDHTRASTPEFVVTITALRN
jgi:hypothetical protein